MPAIESYRPSIISPAPGRYVNVGTDRCLCSCSSLLGARACLSGRLSSAPQPMSVRSTPKEIADLTRTILPPVYPYGLLVKKAATRSRHLAVSETIVVLLLFPFHWIREVSKYSCREMYVDISPRAIRGSNTITPTHPETGLQLTLRLAGRPML